MKENIDVVLMLQLLACAGLLLLAAAPVDAAHRGPTDWSDWEKYRRQVKHPATVVKPEDLDRARRNIERYDWARKYRDSIGKYADQILGQITPAYLERMIEVTTPGCVGPCPACRAKGLPWHPNGQWSWSASKPDRLTCRVCKTVFPNDEFPESIVLQSKWDPRQKFGFIGGETFRCFGYHYARPSLSGIIRRCKVNHVTGQLHALGTAYALTQDGRYARAAKAILLRFAEVLPKYLVRAGYGYGEYADCDPHVAAERINNLPVDELVYPPNKPDRKIFTGYWSASRVGTSGMDGGWVSRVTEAYDLTCEARDRGDTIKPEGRIVSPEKSTGKPVYSDDDRVRIERDVLLESAYLAACDPSINNKSVGNRAGAAVVGLCVGHPGLVRFGLDGFQKTVSDWFLPDGGTSESAAYAMMTMGGIRPFGLAFRDYSDPEGYAPPDGKRLEAFNACRDTLYGDCWQGLIWNLQGNLRHAPLADSYRTTGIDSRFAELIALAYPTDEHVALLKELVGDKPRGGAAREAIFYREPGLEARKVPKLGLPDAVFPYLAQGYLRRGVHGRKGLAVLSATDWGGHHHIDSLSLYYWQDGRELLSDLGYLWDHPDSHQTRRTLAHNLVMIDGRDQLTKGRGGSFHLFSLTPRVKVMEASSNAYGNGSEYRRTCIQVDHGPAGSYLVDVFRASGGTVREYVFHGPGMDYTVDGLDLKPAQSVSLPVRFAVRFHLPALGEIIVDDVEIKEVKPDGSEGPNLAPAPSVAGSKGKPAGWGCYRGDGKAEWALAKAGQGHDAAVRFRATAPHANGRVNVALLVGDSDGYRGTKALKGNMGAKYKLRFAIRGSAERVNVGFVTWPNDPKSPQDRFHRTVSLTGASRVSAGKEWTRYEAAFELPDRGIKLANQRQCPGDQPWRMAWNLDASYRFAAWAPGAPGEVVVLGEGWGQRDHRNTDRGATLPYVLRRREKRGGSDTFVSVFAGWPKDRELVRGVTRLPLPRGAPRNAVALAVQTHHGVDLVVTQVSSSTLGVATPFGKLLTNARVAVVLSQDGSPTYACCVAGASLRVPGVDLSVDAAVYSGAVLGVGSGPGESYFRVQGQLPASDALAAAAVFVTGDDGIQRGYPIRAVRQSDDGVRIYTKLNHVGFEARPAARWEVPTTVAWQGPQPEDRK